MQDKTWYSILGLDAEPLFLQDHMLKQDFTCIFLSARANSYCPVQCEIPCNGLVPTYLATEKIGKEVPSLLNYSPK